MISGLLVEGRKIEEEEETKTGKRYQILRCLGLEETVHVKSLGQKQSGLSSLRRTKHLKRLWSMVDESIQG